MTRVPSGQYRHSVSLPPKYRLALRLKNGKPHQSPSAQNRKIGSDCSFHASQLVENCSFSDRAGIRITLPFISNLLLLFLWLGPFSSPHLVVGVGFCSTRRMSEGEEVKRRRRRSGQEIQRDGSEPSNPGTD